MKYRNGMSESEAGKLGAEKSKIISAQKKQERIKLYNENPKLCKQCSVPLSYDKKYNTFCSSSCAAKYNNKNKHVVDYKKQTETLYTTLITKNYHLYKNNPDYILCNHITKTGKTIQLYKKKNKICKYCGQEECICPDICKKHQLFKSLIKFGFDYNVVGTNKLPDEFNRVKNIIETFYKKHNSNNSLLKETFGYVSGPANFQKLLKSLNIQSKTISEAIIDSYLNGNNIVNDSNKYYSEWHITWEGKEVYLRSSYELDYAKELDNKKIRYDVECLRIKYYDSVMKKYRCAIPDFYLPDTNEIVEIKSTWTIKGKVQEMKDKFIEYIKLEYVPKLILNHNEINIFDINEDYINKIY